jgi:glycosyltransferase 2 family protein
MAKKNIYKSSLFIAFGIALFLLVFKDTNISTLRNQLREFNPYWILVSVLINLLSQFIRAHRWSLLFKPLDYSPKVYNLYLATLIMGFTNQIIPHGGEVARLAVVNKTENIPVSKLVGITLTERLTDLFMIISIFTVPLIFQFETVSGIVDLSQLSINLNNIIWVIAGIFVLIAIVLILNQKYNLFRKIKERFVAVSQDIKEGLSSFHNIKNKPLYILETFIIYSLWLVMCYVLFFSFPPTERLSPAAAFLTFGLASLAYLLPVQSGMGAWHYVVIHCLLQYNVDFESGQVFSLIAHSTTNLIFVLIGIIAFLILLIMNSKKAYRYKINSALS